MASISIVFEYIAYFQRKDPRGATANIPDFKILIEEFEVRSRSYFRLRTNTNGKFLNPLILLAIGKIIPLLFFYKDWFVFK